MSDAVKNYNFCILLPLAAAAWVMIAGADRSHSLTIMAIVALAAAVSSIAGFAFSAICGAMLFHLHDDPVRIVQLMITCSIANQVAMTWSARADIDWRALAPYLAGGALGLGPGVWVLLHVDRLYYTHALGGFLTAYGFYLLVRRPMAVRRPPPAMDVAAGFLGGITGGAAGFPSAFVSIWCGMKGWDKRRQRAVLQPYVLVMQIAALLAINLARRDGAAAGFDAVTLFFVPASLLGTSLGLALYRRLSDAQFGYVVNALLLAAGLSYVV